MKKLNFSGLVIATLLILSVISAPAAANNSVNKEITVKKGELFSLELPETPEKEGYQYYWIPTFDVEYIKIYSDYALEEHVFRALKKGKTKIKMEQYEIDSEGNTNLLKTIEYTITIK
jgi:hypothetical protein